MRKPGKLGLTHLRVTLSGDVFIGPGKADLLELIAETGAIAEAARRMDMSYKRAWMLVRTLNDGFATPLVATVRGGKGQGAHLTDAGRDVLARYRAIERKAADAITQDVAALMALMPRDP